MKILTAITRNEKTISFLYKNKIRKFIFCIHKEENIYVAKCPEVGTVSQGKTIEEALKNLKEATELYLEEFPVKVIVPPLMTTFEVAEIASA